MQIDELLFEEEYNNLTQSCIKLQNHSHWWSLHQYKWICMIHFI